MRRKPTIKNLGAFNEAVFVCSMAKASYFIQVAEILTNDYGIRSEVFPYDAENAFTDDVRKLLKRSYHVIFIVDSQAIIDSAAAGGEKHPFRKVYEYVKRHNRFAISHATTESNALPELARVVYPKSMQGFNSLHRKQILIETPQKTAKSIEPELRRHYPRKQRSAMRYIVYNNNGLREFNEFYNHDIRKSTFAYAWYGAIIAVLNALLPTLKGFVEEPYSTALNVLFIITCAIMPVIGFIYMIRRNTILNFDKRRRLKKEVGITSDGYYAKNSYDSELESKRIRIEEKRANDSRSYANLATLFKLIVCAVVATSLCVKLQYVGYEYLSIIYAATSAYLFVAHAWTKNNLLWLKQSNKYMQYAMKREKVLKSVRPFRAVFTVLAVLAFAFALLEVINSALISF
ncbi:MAG: hypothetical protein J6Q72_02265 [Clostridia bacterium]|nr:hypothetical protein [Clostridia bacterium]